MKVVALVSGGKDSLFSILHCRANGHHVVALANLYHRDELDSFMYQTVGQSVVPLYGQALDLPLYRREIRGSAVDRGKEYSGRDGSDDETESLVPLLRQVLRHHPDVDAVCTGAILSDYQRTRVESVAARLGLVSLAYLWQYPHLPPHVERSLLDDMAAVGQDARIVKVASGGLDESFLWERVDGARVQRAVARFGEGDGGVLGEGGEYESLAVDGPRPLWKAAIEFVDREVMCGEGGVAYIRGGEARLVPKGKSDDDVEESKLRIPGLLDDRFAAIVARLRSSSRPALVSASSPPRPVPLKYHETRTRISNITAPGSTAAEQTTVIMRRLTPHLPRVTQTTVLVGDMADFAAVNAAYGAFFSHGPLPPARVTIATHLPPSVLVVISARLGESPRSAGLHVQSRSYWAPANIGPYSQAIVDRSRRDEDGGGAFDVVEVAGQIPLIPASMDPVQGDWAVQCVLALQHLWRIGEAVGVTAWLGGVAFVVADGGEVDVETVCSAWRLAHRSSAADADDDDDDQEEDDADPWDKLQRGERGTATRRSLQDGPACDGVPPCYVVQVAALPRGVRVEWTSTGVVGGDGARVKVQAGTVQAGRVRWSWSADEDGIDEASVVYTTRPVEGCAATVVPCSGIWDGMGRRVSQLTLSCGQGHAEHV